MRPFQLLKLKGKKYRASTEFQENYVCISIVLSIISSARQKKLVSFTQKHLTRACNMY